MKSPQPSDLELQVLSVLWRSGPSTARQVLEAMPDGKERAYTTILTVLQVMEKKGLLTHTQEGNKYIYKPAVTRTQVLRPILRGWVAKIFGGSPSAAVEQLLSETDVDEQELQRIQDFLKEYRPSGKRREGGSR